MKVRYQVQFQGEVVGINFWLTHEEAWKMMRRGYHLVAMASQ